MSSAEWFLTDFLRLPPSKKGAQKAAPCRLRSTILRLKALVQAFHETREAHTRGDFFPCASGQERARQFVAVCYLDSSALIAALGRRRNAVGIDREGLDGLDRGGPSRPH